MGKHGITPFDYDEAELAQELGRPVVIIVSDAGPIIHLSLVGRIDLLPSL